MNRILRFGLIAAVTATALVIPTRAASSETPPPVIEVIVSLTDLPPAVVNVSVPEQPAPTITIPDQPAPVVNLTVPEQPAPIVNVEAAAAPPPQVVYKDREVEVERIVEVRSCLDYAELPHFDLANALVAAFPGAQWSLSGSHYPGLNWLDSSPKPDMTAIIRGWLTHLEKDC